MSKNAPIPRTNRGHRVVKMFVGKMDEVKLGHRRWGPSAALRCFFLVQFSIHPPLSSIIRDSQSAALSDSMPGLSALYWC